MSSETIFRVSFLFQGEVYEIYAAGVSQGSMFGFVEVEELRFGERTQVVVDPSEEELKAEFEGVRRTYLPLHSVIRIDEVEKEGVSRVSEGSDADGVLTPFPTPVPTPSGPKSSD